MSLAMSRAGRGSLAENTIRKWSRSSAGRLSAAALTGGHERRATALFLRAQQIVLRRRCRVRERKASAVADHSVARDGIGRRWRRTLESGHAGYAGKRLGDLTGCGSLLQAHWPWRGNVAPPWRPARAVFRHAGCS